MYIDVERVRKAKANTLWGEFDVLMLRDGEFVDDFGIRINKIAHQLVVLNYGHARRRTSSARFCRRYRQSTHRSWYQSRRSSICATSLSKS
ncbi:unnamed protein product [Urochloa humidicola]